jgi:hypothetical protein
VTTQAAPSPRGRDSHCGGVLTLMVDLAPTCARRHGLCCSTIARASGGLVGTPASWRYAMALSVCIAIGFIHWSSKWGNFDVLVAYFGDLRAE